MKSSLAILLTCHNRKDKTLNCLKAVFDNDIPSNYEMDIFLVDDGSTDGTAELVKERYSSVNIIYGNGQLFWNRGMYLAWETAVMKNKFDFYMWLNDDTQLFNNALSTLLNYSQTINNERILVGATCSFVNKEKITYSGYTYPNIKLIPNKTWQDCDFFNGNIVLIPSYVYNVVGLLDKRFRHSFGDFDYGKRASKLGFSHSLSPYCLGICEDHVSLPIWQNRSFSVYKRLKYLHNPLGNNPIESFIYEFRHNGLFLAILRFIFNYLRAILPQLWEYKKSIYFSLERIKKKSINH